MYDNSFHKLDIDQLGDMLDVSGVIVQLICQQHFLEHMVSCLVRKFYFFLK